MIRGALPSDDAATPALRCKIREMCIFGFRYFCDNFNLQCVRVCVVLNITLLCQHSAVTLPPRITGNQDGGMDTRSRVRS